MTTPLKPAELIQFIRGATKYFEAQGYLDKTPNGAHHTGQQFKGPNGNAYLLSELTGGVALVNLSGKGLWQDLVKVKNANSITPTEFNTITRGEFFEVIS